MLSAGFFGGFAFGPPAFGWLLVRTDDFMAAWLSLAAILAVGALLCFVLLNMRHRT
jgi:biotin transporter BioY